jgi:hypothetical protein
MRNIKMLVEKPQRKKPPDRATQKWRTQMDLRETK